MVQSYIDEESTQIRPAVYVQEVDPTTPWLAEPDLLKNVKQEQKDEIALAIFCLSAASLVCYMLWDNREIILLEQAYGSITTIEMFIIMEIIMAVCLVIITFRSYLIEKSTATFNILRAIVLFWLVRVMWIFSLFYSRTSRAVAEFFSLLNLLVLIWLIAQVLDQEEYLFVFIFVFFWQIYWIYYTFLVSSHPWILVREEDLPNIF